MQVVVVAELILQGLLALVVAVVVAQLEHQVGVMALQELPIQVVAVVVVAQILEQLLEVMEVTEVQV
jgi:hypothetical protein